MQKAAKDQKGALADYRKSLALGGTVSLPELYSASGAKLSFDYETLSSIVEMIELHLDELEKNLA